MIAYWCGVVSKREENVFGSSTSAMLECVAVRRHHDS